MDYSKSLYGAYIPSKGAAIFFVIAFCLFTILHVWKVLKTRQWFGIVTIVAGLFEIIGLAARAKSNDEPTDDTLYKVQFLLTFLAPILYTGAIYMFLGRLIRATGYPDLSFIRINWLTKIFVAGDVLCFLIQATGAGKLVGAGSSEDEKTTGKIIILTGLALQIFFFCIFIVCAATFDMRIKRRVSEQSANIDPKLRLRLRLCCIYLSSLLISVRNFYRLVEYAAGEEGYLMTHEWPVYALDVALMLIVMAIGMICYLPGSRSPMKSEC